MKMLQSFIDTFATLTHLDVFFNSRDENAIYKPLKNISNLKHLIHFQLHNRLGVKINRFCGLLKQMGNNCKNLKSIDIRFNINDQNSDIKQLWSQLKGFPLKRLNLLFSFFNNEEDSDNEDIEQDIDVIQLFSFELLKNFSNITHLTLRFDQILKELILKEIDINLSKLQYLEINKDFDTTPEGVQQMAVNLSRLSRLETLKLVFKKETEFKSFYN